MPGLYQRSERSLNFAFDRIIDCCDLILMDAYPLPRLVRTAAAHIVSDVVLLLRHLPRLPATKFRADGWRMIYVGEPGSEPELCRILFQQPPEIIDRGRYTAGRTVYDIEGGYLHTDPRCASHGMNALLNWYLIDWARQRGITTYNMDISNAWPSDGPFTFRRRWGVRGRRSQMICPDLHLLLDDPPPTLVEHLNAAGQFFSAPIGAPADMPAARAAAQEAGLAGVIEVRREG